MTNEEAICTLANFKRYISGGGVIDKQANSALDMAIEALENNDKLAEDLQNCLEMYKKKKAEVEFLKKQWIPCEEKLPEVGEDVFISVGGDVWEAHLRASKEYFLIHSGRMLVKTEETDAWQPLPKAYEGRTE